LILDFSILDRRFKKRGFKKEMRNERGEIQILD
jgi:hypothetical protein